LTASGSFFFIKNKATGKVMAIENASMMSTANAVQQTQSSATNQQWSFVEVPCPNVLLTKTSTVSSTQEDLLLTVHPNPSNSYFNLVISSTDNSPVNVRILDVYGRVISQRQGVAPGSVLQLGHTWINGVYFAEILQNGKTRVVKMIKGVQK